MDYSAVIIPVTKADKSVDTFDHHYQQLNEVDRKNWEACGWIMHLCDHSDQLTKLSKATPRLTMARLWGCKSSLASGRRRRFGQSLRFSTRRFETGASRHLYR